MPTISCEDLKVLYVCFNVVYVCVGVLLLLSTQTTSNNVQEIIENKVEKRTKGIALRWSASYVRACPRSVSKWHGTRFVCPTKTQSIGNGHSCNPFDVTRTSRCISNNQYL